MYIKFLIGSAIFALICFGIGYRVCWLRMEKKVKTLGAYLDKAKGSWGDLHKAQDELIQEQRKQIALLKGMLGLPTHREGWVGEYEGERIAAPSSGMVRNDNWEDDGR